MMFFGKIKIWITVVLVLGGSFLSLPQLGAAREIPPTEGLEALRRCFAGTRDFTAEITQEKQIALMKKKMVSTGEVRFRKPDSFYMDMKAPYASRLLLRDNMLSMFLPAEGIRQKTALPPEEGLRHWMKYLDQPVRSLPAGMDIKADKTGRNYIVSIFPGSKGGVKAIRLAFVENEGIIRLAIEERNRDRTVISFRSMRRNVGLSEKDFRLE
jgi:outer membrane lipoprotein carrier protein